LQIGNPTRRDDAMPRHRIDWYGPRLRQLREEAGLSQAQLGQRIELHGSQVNKLETNVNQPTLATALAIAEALGRPLADFLPDDGTQPCGPTKRGGRTKKGE
jgi:transcriptional regulator with XRE-family HTH domain